MFDHNKPRNAVTHASHGFLTRDGITPAEFRRVAYEEVLTYPSVEHHPVEVTDIRKLNAGFLISTHEGEQIKAHKLLFASGLQETLPDIPGIRDLYGKSLFYCPYCDGWELRDKSLFVLSDHPNVFHLAKLLYNWSRDLIVCTNGPGILTVEQKQILAARDIVVSEQSVSAFHGSDGKLRQVEFTDGSRTERTGGFIAPKWVPRAAFQQELGYAVTDLGGILTDGMGKSTVPGLFAAGEVTTGSPSQLIVVAAAGSIAAASINLELTEEDFCS